MTDASEDEWGPWIEHDGNGCPCVGMWVQVESEDRGIEPLPGGPAFGGASWFRQHWFFADPIIRYRIRKPRGMKVLQELLQDLPETVPDCEGTT